MSVETTVGRSRYLHLITCQQRFREEAKFRKKAAKAKAKRKQAAGDDEEMEIFKVAFDKDGKPAKRVVNKKKEKKRPVDPRMERSKLLMEALEMMPGPEEVEQPTEEEQEKIDKESLYATHKVQPRPPSRGVNEDQLEKRVAPISFTVEKEDGSHAFIKEGEVVVLLADNDPDDKWWRGYPQGRVEDAGEFKKDVLELERKVKTGPMGTPLPEEPAAEVAPLQEQPALPAPERAVVDVAPPPAPAPPEPEPEPEPAPAPAPARVPLEPEPVPVPVPQPAPAQPPAPTSRPAQPDRTDQPEPEPELLRKSIDTRGVCWEPKALALTADKLLIGRNVTGARFRWALPPHASRAAVILQWRPAYLLES